MRKRRGSAVVMCLILVAAITSIIAAQLTLATTGLRFETKAECRRIAKEIFDGAVVQVVEDFYNDNLTVPGNKNVVINGFTCATTVADNSSDIKRTLEISGSVTVKGSVYNFNTIVGARHEPSPFFYACAIKGGVDTYGTLTTGSCGTNGDVFSGADLLLHVATNTVNGDAECVGTYHGPNTTVTGETTAGASAITFPTVSASTYRCAADLYCLYSSIDGFSFGSGGSYYPLIYSDGSLQIKGTFSGKGTIFVHGNVTVVGDMAYADSCSRLAIVCDGDIFFESWVNKAVGYYSAQGNTISQGSYGVTVTRGGIVTGGLYWNGTLKVTHDPAVWDDVAEGRKLRLPGMW